MCTTSVASYQTTTVISGSIPETKHAVDARTMGNDASKSGKSGFGFKGIKVPGLAGESPPSPMPPRVESNDELTLTQHSDRQSMTRGIIGKSATTPIIIQTKNNILDDELTLTQHEKPMMRRILTQEDELTKMLGITPPRNQSTSTMKVRLEKELAAENMVGMRSVRRYDNFVSESKRNSNFYRDKSFLYNTVCVSP